MTYRQLIYMILDLLKQLSKDSLFEEEHIIKEINNVRTLLLKQKYSDVRKEVAYNNYQHLDLDFTDISQLNKKYYLIKSGIKIPQILSVISSNVSLNDMQNFRFVSDYKFVYTGYNNWLSNIIYGTILSDSFLYLKSINPQLKHLKSARFVTIFENPLEVYNIQSPATANNTIDLIDNIFPLEDSMIAELQDIVIKRLMLHLTTPKDTVNNNNDDLTDLQIQPKQ